MKIHLNIERRIFISENKEIKWNDKVTKAFQQISEKITMRRIKERKVIKKDFDLLPKEVFFLNCCVKISLFVITFSRWKKILKQN